MKRYSFWIGNELVEDIKKLARKMGMNVSTFFRMAIIEKLDKELKNDKK